MRALPFAFPLCVSIGLLTACRDPAACDEIGATRCETTGRAILRCAQTERGPRWQTEPCPESTPSCVQGRGAGRAVWPTCIGERLGSCDVASFEDSCPDARTLEDCTAGTRHRYQCDPGQECGVVPEYARGDDRPPNATHACYTPRGGDSGPPALVTFVHGHVEVDGAPPPGVPFRIGRQGVLRLREGARAVVLFDERASRISGPRDVQISTLAPEAVVAPPWARPLIEGLSEEPPGIGSEERLRTPAPTSAGLVRLRVGEGVPGASSGLGPVAWTCDGECGRTVELRDDDGHVLWRETGVGSVRYAGPELEPNETYQLRVGEQSYRVETTPPNDLRPLLTQTRGWPLAEQMSVIAAAHLVTGSRAAAVATLFRASVEQQGHDQDILALLVAYGVGPR